jgi:rubredoxin
MCPKCQSKQTTVIGQSQKPLLTYYRCEACGHIFAPEVDAPQVNVPQANVPQANVPQANVPRAKVPSAKRS